MTEKESRRETAFSVTVANLWKYDTEGGYAEDVTINFPENEETIKKELEKVTYEDHKTLVVLDIETREESEYMYEAIGDFQSPESLDTLNVIANLMGDEPHPAAEAYLQENPGLSFEEITNLFMQESEIPYYPYEFDGSGNPELMERLSNEEKMGYTYIEGFPELHAALENLEINETSVINYLDVEAIGRDLSLNGNTLLENGYFDSKANSLDLSVYTVDEIKQELAEREQAVELEKEERIEQQEKTGKTKEQQRIPQAPSL